MQYVLMIYGSEQIFEALTPAEKAKLGEEMGKFAVEMRAAGKLVGGHPLQSVATSTTVRLKDGKSLVTDGPFAETKEQLGGFMVIEAADIDEALTFVSKIPPASPHTAIEIRPVIPVPR